MTYEAFDVIVVPFPFTDRDASKRRPALIVSNSTFNKIDHSVCCMITTQSHSPWPGDTDINDLESAGLDHPSLVRLKLFTLDHRLIIKKIGQLSENDRKSFEQNFTGHVL